MNPVIRPLSIHEASFPVYAELVPGGGNIVVCLRLSGELSAEQAEQGLEKLRQAEASLQVASQFIHKAETNQQNNTPTEGYYFVQPVNPRLPFAYTELDISDDFSQVLDQQRTQFLNQSFQQGELLWRAHLVSEKNSHQHALLLCINHSISDGTSVYHLMKRWLLALHNSTDIIATANDFSLPLWHYMPKKISGFLGAFRSLGILSTFMKAQKLADKGLSFKAEGNVPIAEHRCRSAHRSLNKATFTSLLKLSKAEKKSIHGLLSAALIQVLLADCKKRGNLHAIGKYFSFPFVTTVNVRDKISTTKTEVDNDISGCLSSGVTSMVDIDQELIDEQYQQSPWHLGEQVATGVKDALEQDQHWKVLRIYQLAGLKGLKKMFIDSSEKPLATPISFANLGPVNFDFYVNRACESNSNALIVEDYQAYAAFHASGAGINTVASSLKGALTLCLTCPSPVMSQQTMDTYADSVIALLASWADV